MSYVGDMRLGTEPQENQKWLNGRKKGREIFGELCWNKEAGTRELLDPLLADSQLDASFERGQHNIAPFFRRPTNNRVSHQRSDTFDVLQKFYVLFTCCKIYILLYIIDSILVKYAKVNSNEYHHNPKNNPVHRRRFIRDQIWLMSLESFSFLHAATDSIIFLYAKVTATNNYRHNRLLRTNYTFNRE